MTKPNERELRALYDECNGVITSVADRLKLPPNTVKHWYRTLGIKGRGKGGQQKLSPPRKELEAAYARHSGNLQAIADEFGRSRTAVHHWLKDIGLAGRGREKFEPIYPLQIPLSVKNGHVVIYSDAHFWPAVKSRAYDGMLVALRKLKPKAVIGNGDLLDGARVSRHDPIGWDDLPKVDEELYEAQQRQAEIARAAPGSEKIGVIGNHDVRFEKYVIRQARELEGIEGMRLADHFPTWRICWSVRINDDVIVKHRFRGGVHATWNNTLHAGLTIVTGHLHSQNVRPKTDYRGTRWGVDAGCLADPGGPQFLYLEANPTDWRSGFCVLTFENGKLLPPQLATVCDDGAVILQRNERLL
jgi:hypothetical protein